MSTYNNILQNMLCLTFVIKKILDVLTFPPRLRLLDLPMVALVSEKGIALFLFRGLYITVSVVQFQVS